MTADAIAIGTGYAAANQTKSPKEVLNTRCHEDQEAVSREV
jgi:hypothetical protein